MSAQTERAAADLDHRLDDYVSAVAWSPSGEALAAVSLAGDGALIVDGKPRPLPVHEGGALSLAWSADGARFATGGQDGVVRMHDMTDGAVDISLGGWVNALAWSPKSLVLAAAAGRDLALIDADGLVVQRDRRASTITSLGWSTDGRRVGAGSYGGIAWYEPGTNAPVKAFDWKGAILTMAMSPNGKWVASGNQDNSAHVWRLWSGEDMEMSGYEAKIEHIAWDPTSRWLCVGGIGETTCWDFLGRGPQGTRPKELRGHSRRITALKCSKRLLASASADGTIRLWKLPATAAKAVIEVGTAISALDWHRDGQRLAAGTADGQVLVLPAS